VEPTVKYVYLTASLPILLILLSLETLLQAQPQGTYLGSTTQSYRHQDWLQVAHLRMVGPFSSPQLLGRLDLGLLLGYACRLQLIHSRI